MISRHWTFWLYIGVGILAVIFFALTVPETKNRSPVAIERDIHGETLADPTQRIGPTTVGSFRCNHR
jgi:predicted MFS family arabinose efflux permease